MRMCVLIKYQTSLTMVVVIHSSAFVPMIIVILIVVVVFLMLVIRVVSLSVATFAAISWLMSLVSATALTTFAAIIPIRVVLSEVLSRGPIPVCILFLAHFITDLTAGPTPTKLSLRLKTIIPINSQLSTVNHHLIQQINCLSCILTPCIFNEAKSALFFSQFIQAHDKIDNLAALTKNLNQLLLQSVEGKISNV